MTARNGLRVRKVRNRTKAWVELHTPAAGALVAFEDLFDMIRLIIECEKEKYEQAGRADGASWDRWAAMPRALLHLACNFGAEWDAVADRFDLPHRDGTRKRPLSNGGLTPAEQAELDALVF